MLGHYAFSVDRVGDGDKAVGGKDGGHQQSRHDGGDEGVVDETPPEVVVFERHLEQGENQADGAKAGEGQEIGDGVGEYGLGKIPGTHDGDDDDGEEEDDGENGYEAYHPSGVALPQSPVEVAEPLDEAFFAHRDGAERVQLQFWAGLVVACAGGFGLHEFLTAILVGVEDEFVTGAVGVSDGQFVGCGSVEADVEHLVSGEAVHGVAWELEPRLRGDAAVVGEGGFEVKTEVGEVPPFAEAAGTHGESICMTGGEELQ